MTEPDKSDPPNSEAIEDVTFEASVLRLESIVTSLEDGRLSLEDSLSAYEEGLNLARSCLARLDQAELRVRHLAAVDDPDPKS